MFYQISSNKTDEKTEKVLNGEQTADSEPLATEGTAVEEDASTINTYYDKSKSFFDNLSGDDMGYLLCFFSVSIPTSSN